MIRLSKDLTVYWYVAVAGLFMLMTGFRLFAEGMFVDGVTYASISRNLAAGQGTFWEPRLSATLYPQFHEHPPLVFGLQGLAFMIFGDSPLVERFYSLAMAILTGYLIVLIWKELTGEKKSGWIPLLFWILFPLVSWATASNLLDNTLVVFTTSAILFIFKNSARNNRGYLVLAGLSLFTGLLAKGPFALFPWVLPFLLIIYRPGTRMVKAISQTLILMFFTLAPLLLLVTVSAAARDNLHAYWINQVVRSLAGVATVSSRFYILGRLLSELAIPVLAVAAMIPVFRKNTDMGKIRYHGKNAIPLILLGLSGVLPIMVSLKQSSFYLLAALPALALAISLPVWEMLKIPLSRLNQLQPGIRIFRYAIILAVCLSLVLPPMLAKHNRRDREELAMIHNFSKVIPEGTTIRINPQLFSDWSLHSYFMRHSGISLDPGENPAADFYLDRNTELTDREYPEAWTRISQINGFVLLKK